MTNIKMAELHVHLEGCVWEKHRSKWAHLAEASFPSVHFDRAKRPISFAEFLVIIRSGYNYLNGMDQYVSVLSDYLDYMEREHVVYAEIQFNSALIRTFNIDIQNLLTQFQKVVDLREGPIVKFIIDLPWQFSANSFNHILEDFEKYQELGVVGISMGGDESFARPLEFAEVFTRARQVGYKILCHAGETSDFKFAKQIIDELKPDRIGHGLSLSDWFEQNKSNRVVVDTCITSNLVLGLVDDVRNHPFGRWLEHDHIIATLSTDDPAIFNTTLKEEYNLGKKHFEHFQKYIEHQSAYLIEAAFDQEAIQQALR